MKMNLWNGKVAKSLILGLAVAVLACPSIGRAQTWVGGTSTDYTDSTNWNPMTVPNATNATALFKANGNPTIDIAGFSVIDLGTAKFNANAQAYTVNITTASLSFYGNGIVNNSSSTQTFNQSGFGYLDFYNGSQAGNAVLNNNNFGLTFFYDHSSAANAQISNSNLGITIFFDHSTAGNATIDSGDVGAVAFYNHATAGTATLTNTFSSTGSSGATFLNNSSAENSTIKNIGGTTTFLDNSTAGNATIKNTLDGSNNVGTTTFANQTDAGTSTIINNGGYTYFTGHSNGATSDITNKNGSITYFQDHSDAGTAAITNKVNGSTFFTDHATADGATIKNIDGGDTSFFNHATADASNITINGYQSRTYFYDNTTAATATITTKNGGLLYFRDNATAENSTINNNTGGGVYFLEKSNAGNSTITNTDQYSGANFFDHSDAGTATITNNNQTTSYFRDHSTADSAIIINQDGGRTNFVDHSTAANANMTNKKYGAITFQDNTDAGNSTITNTKYGTVSFYNKSTADTATFVNGGQSNIFFNDKSTAGSSTITNQSGSGLEFHDNSTAASSTLNNNGNGYLLFFDKSTAANATINNNKGSFVFYDHSTAANAVITNKSTINFAGNSTAANSSVTNNKNGQTSFLNHATAADSTILNNKGATYFYDHATAANSSITNQKGGSTTFSDHSGAGSANIVNQGMGNYSYTLFTDNSSAQTATILNKKNGATSFAGFSTAGKSIITNNNGGAVYFSNEATGGKARIINNAGGLVDLSSVDDGGITIGTISGAGDIDLGANNLTFLGRSDDKKPVISGTIYDEGDAGSITLDSNNSLTLSGNNTYSGGTYIENGTLKVGSATALGTGDVVLYGGKLRVAGTNGPTDINVGGNYFQPNGTLQLAVYAPFNDFSDRLNVFGNAATLGPDSTLNLAFPGNPGGGAVPSNTSYDLVHNAAGGITGQFGTVLGLENFSLVPGQFSMIAYTPTDVTLYIRQFLGFTSGLTPNQQAVANYIDGLAPKTFTGNIGNLINNLYPLTDGPTSTLTSALDQLSPQSLQIFSQVAFNNTTFTNQQLNNHLANLRDGLTGFDSSQLSYTDSTMVPGLANIKSRLLAWNPASTPGLMSDVSDSLLSGVMMTDAKDMKTMSEVEPVNHWSTFISGDVILAEVDPSKDVSYQNYTTGGVTLGADYRIDKHFTVGSLLAYGHTDANLDHIGSQVTVDSYSPGIFASFVDGGWYANAMGSYSYNSYTSSRNVQINTINGSNRGATQGNQFDGNLTGGYEFQRGGWKFGPTASLQYVNLGVQSFNEDGPTALNVNGQSAESLRSQLGLEARYALKCGSMFLTPHAFATWQHEYLDDSRGITSQFNGVGPGSFTVQTDNPTRDSAFVGAGLNIDVNKSVTVFTDYASQVGGNYFGQSVQAGVKIGF